MIDRATIHLVAERLPNSQILRQEINEVYKSLARVSGALKVLRVAEHEHEMNIDTLLDKVKEHYHQGEIQSALDGFAQRGGG